MQIIPAWGTKDTASVDVLLLCSRIVVLCRFTKQQRGENKKAGQSLLFWSFVVVLCTPVVEQSLILLSVSS